MIRPILAICALLLTPGAALALAINPPALGKGGLSPFPHQLEDLLAGLGVPAQLPAVQLPAVQLPAVQLPTLPGNAVGGPPFGVPAFDPPHGGGPPEGTPPVPNVPAMGNFPLDAVPPPLFVRDANDVPEPGAALLLATSGAAGLAWWGRGRKRR